MITFWNSKEQLELRRDDVADGVLEAGRAAGVQPPPHAVVVVPQRRVDVSLQVT